MWPTTYTKNNKKNKCFLVLLIFFHLVRPQTRFGRQKYPPHPAEGAERVRLQQVGQIFPEICRPLTPQPGQKSAPGRSAPEACWDWRPLCNLHQHTLYQQITFGWFSVGYLLQVVSFLLFFCRLSCGFVFILGRSGGKKISAGNVQKLICFFGCHFWSLFSHISIFRTL